MAEIQEKPAIKYELSFWLRDEGGFSAVKSILDRNGCTIVRDVEMRQVILPQPIKKETAAVLGSVHFTCKDPVGLGNITRDLNLESACLRALLVKNPAMPAPEREPRRIVPVERKAEKPEARSSSDTVTNEELEKKLEEILK